MRIYTKFKRSRVIVIICCFSVLSWILVYLNEIFKFLVGQLSISEYYDLRTRSPELCTPKMFFQSNARHVSKEPPRILCWITTYPAQHQRAFAARDTWGRHCDTFLIMSTGEKKAANSTEGNIVYLPMPPSYDLLWKRTQLALHHIWQHHRGSFDYLLKADDDTYIFYTNLLDLVSDFDPKDSFFFGHPFFTPQFGTYMSGGAGYVMTEGAFERLMTQVLTDKSHLFRDFFDSQQHEDVAVGLCMANVSAIFVAGVDVDNRIQFLPVKIERFWRAEVDWWYPYLKSRTTFVDGSRDMSECCSERLISLHYVGVEQMRRLRGMGTSEVLSARRFPGEGRT